MPHSKLKERAHLFNSGVAKSLCGQTFDFTLEGDQDMKFRLHCKVCPKLAVKVFNEVRIPKKATTLREQQHNEAKRMKRVLAH